MQDARVFYACEREAGEVAAWLERRLRAGGKPEAEASRVAARLKADWPELIHLLFHHDDCETQMVMLSISGEGAGIEVSLVTETCGSYSPCIAREAAAKGLGALVRDEVEGLARLTIPMKDYAGA